MSLSMLQLVISLALIGLGTWWMLPRPVPLPRVVGLVLVLAGGISLTLMLRVQQTIVDEFLFWVFGASAPFFGILMITGRNPVYSALSFALATLSLCGLFLLQSAPFLAAATIIVYAGAIVVTFVFVIMLAQQAGATGYDQRSKQPAMATVGAFVLLGAILFMLGQAGSKLVAAAPLTEAEQTAELMATLPNSLSHPRPGEELGTLHGLGRSLFGDYLFSVEIAGTLLLIASVGAIAIAPRRGQGTL